MNKEIRKIEIIKWIVFGICLGLGLWVNWIEYKKYIETRSGDLLSIVNTVKASINSDNVIALSGDSSDLEKPEYIKLREQFTWVVNSSENVRYLYMMGFDPSRSRDKMFFFLDSQPDEINGNKTDSKDLAIPGEVYEETNGELLDVYRMGGQLLITVPEVDKWGSFVSAIVPISEKGSGKIVALLGADMMINNQLWEVFKVLLPSLIDLTLVLILEWVVFTFWIRQREKEIEEIRIKSILENSDDAIYSCDLEGKVTDWNSSAEKLYGYKKEEVLGRNLEFYASKDMVGEVRNNILNVKQGKAIVHQKTKRVNKSGNELKISLNMAPILDRSLRAMGISIIARDIGHDQEREGELIKKNIEIEKLNVLMVNREMKMIELKKKIEDLEVGIK